MIAANTARARAELLPVRAPGPPAHRLLSSLRQIRGNAVTFSARLFEDYGDLVFLRFGRRRIFLLRDPADAHLVLCEHAANYRKGLGLDEAAPLLGEGLLRSHGTTWQTSRQLFQPCFRARPAPFEDAAAPIAEAFADRVANHAPSLINIADEMACLALETLGKALLDYDLHDLAVRVMTDLRIMTAWAMLQMKSVLPLPWRWPSPRNLRARRSLARLDALAEEMFDARLASGSAPAGSVAEVFLAQLHGAAERRQMRDDFMTFLLAGHDTTGATLTWAIYLLARHSEARAMVQDELAHQVGSRTPTVRDLPQLCFLRQVVEETLRLYPPVWLLPRRAIAADRIRGFDIPAGSEVLVHVYGMHRHPRLWPEPESFRPDRFRQRGAENTPLRGFMPFGIGARACIGGRFGVNEAMLVLAVLLQRFNPELASDKEPALDDALTLWPRGGIWMRLCPR